MSCFKKMIYGVILIFLQFLPHAKPAAIDICYLIDETQNKLTVQHSVQEKLQLASDITRCLLSKGADTKIATVVYDNHSAKLGFNFKSVDDILNDGFQNTIFKQRQRRNSEGARKIRKKSSFKRNTIRVFSDVKSAKSLDPDSPQTMAFLTAAEAVVAAESQSNGRVPNFKVLVISDSDVFPVMDEVKKYFLNASVEINAIDLSKAGSSDLERIVTWPSSQHYFYSPVINVGLRTLVNNVCERLSQAAPQIVQPFFKFSKLLTRPLKDIAPSTEVNESPQYQYPAVATNNMFPDLDKYIEGDSGEYKWSPRPELEPAEYVTDTPEEYYGAETKKDICKYMHGECETYMKSGLCTDESLQAQGMKKFCKTTCGFCGS